MKKLFPLTVLITLGLGVYAGQPAQAQEPEPAAPPETAATPETAAAAGTALGEESEPCCDEVDGEDRVAFGRDLVIGVDEVVTGDAVSVLADLTIHGTVKGDAACVGGKLTVGPKAEICCDAVSVGGTADISPEAKIGGEKIAVQIKIPGLKGIKWLGPLGEAASDLSDRVVKAVGEFVFFALLMFVALLLTVFLPRQFGRVEEHLAGDFPRSALIGVAALLLFPLAVLVLSVTLIGIPVAVLLVLAVLISLLVGYIVLGKTLGRKLVGERHVMLQVFVGLLLLQAAALAGDALALPGGIFEMVGGIFVGIGWVIFIGGSFIGLGAVVYSYFGKRTLAETEAAREARKANRVKNTVPPAKVE